MNSRANRRFCLRQQRAASSPRPLTQTDGRRASATMRGLPWPSQRGHWTPRSATRIDASGSRGFTRKSRSPAALAGDNRLAAQIQTQSNPWWHVGAIYRST
jgi:hypothetical protein